VTAEKTASGLRAEMRKKSDTQRRRGRKFYLRDQQGPEAESNFVYPRNVKKSIKVLFYKT
jgi:hypothetical protein